MSLPLIFLGLLLFAQYEEQVINHRATHPYSSHLIRLVSLDPQTRLRAAWFIPEFAVKAETLAVAGSRHDDLCFSLDNVPLQDPQTGKLSVLPPATLVQAGDLSFNGLSLAPTAALSSRGAIDGRHAQLGGVYPFLFYAGGEGRAETFINIPLGNKFSVSLDGAAFLHRQRPQADLLLPHSEVAAYTGAASATLRPSDGMLVQAVLMRSQEQRDHFSPQWTFNPASAPSTLTAVDLIIFNYRYRTDALDLSMTLSGYGSFLWEGSRKQGKLTLFKRFDEQDAAEHAAGMDVSNPFGVRGLFYSEGFSPSLTARNSTANRPNPQAGVFAGKMHETQTRLIYTTCNLIADISKWDAAVERTAIYQKTPRLAELYAGDRIHLDRFWVEPGLGLTYLEIEKPDTSGVEVEITENKISLAPHIEARAYLKETLIRAGMDMPAVIPAFSTFFDTKNESPLADSVVMIPRQDPAPERAWVTWLDVGKGWGKRWSAGLSLHSIVAYRLLSGGLNPTDTIADTIQTAGVFQEGQGLSFSISPRVEYHSDWLSARAAYRFSSGKANTSGAAGDYEGLLAGQTLPDQAQRLPLDSRHKFCLEGNVSAPADLSFMLREWFLQPGMALASGFPDEDGEDTKLAWWAWCEIAAGRVISVGGFSAEIRLELLNPFNWKEPVFGEPAPPSLPTQDDFPDRVVLGDEDYRSSRDANHDGVITAAEEVDAYRRAREFYDAWTPSPLPARSLEFKVFLKF